MDQFIIQGQRPLSGDIHVGGAKNAALPIMAACLLTDEECILDDVPDLADIRSLTNLLTTLGATVQRDGTTVRIKVNDESCCLAEYEIVRRMRASICVLGPLLAKRHQAQSQYAGGLCHWRPAGRSASARHGSTGR